MFNDLPELPPSSPETPGRATVPAPARRRSPPMVEAAPDVDWGRYRTAIWRFRWWVLLITLLGTAAGVGASRIVRPVYVARATIWIEGANEKQPGPGPAGSGDLLGATGWVDLVRSYVVVAAVVNDRQLYLTPASPSDSAVFAGFSVAPRFRPGSYRLEVDQAGRGFTLATHDAVVLQRGAAGDSVGGALGFVWLPPAAELSPLRRLEFVVESPHEAASRLAERLRVKTDLEGNFLRVELRGQDPRKITVIVNAVAQRFVAVAADLKRQQLTELVRILGEQLNHSQVNLSAAESALRDLLSKTVSFVADGATPVAPGLQFTHDPGFASYFETKVNLEQVRRDRAAIERLLAQVRDSGLPVDALAAIGAVDRSTELVAALRELTAKRAELRALQQRYTEEHGTVRRLAGEVQALEGRTIPALARVLVSELAARDAELTQRVRAASAELRQIPSLAIEDARLRREVANAERLFTSIQQRYDEARLAEVSTIPEVSVLDAAVEPEEPLLDPTPFLVLVSFLGSLGLAALGAVVLERADRKVRYPDQVTRTMGLPILGAVPHVSWHDGANGDGVSRVIEALRGIRLNVLHAYGTAGPLLVTVTSPGRSDGKSFLTSNLAVAFVDAGYSTLLIDGDIRRGGLHRVLDAARTPGLTDLLAGTAAVQQVIQQAKSYPSLAFIACGSRTRSGPELLSSTAMAGFVTSLRSRYAVILIDSPPLAAGVDACALGTMTGSLVLVLRTGVSDRELVEAKLDVLERLPIRILGAVLNDVRPGGAYRSYAYSLSGYDLHDEEEPPKRILRSVE
ncbi:MAG: hypothetical protein AUH45_10140 [Gemmatimonadetes bacterium 13_1_40CM_69_22]|nr:MAG: hypothetical protein AUH45_10140 [Gemmatimonadetes bacterium 13_1_40CM_69_22]